MNCTWVDCKDKASWPQKDKNGKVWANLCQEHHLELETALEESLKDSSNSFKMKLMLSCYVKAQGGAKEMAKRMQPAVETGVKLASFLKTVGKK